MSIFGLILIIIITASAAILAVMARLMKAKYILDSYVVKIDEVFLERLEILMDISLEVCELYELLEDIYGMSVRVVEKKLPAIREHFLPYKHILEQSEDLEYNTRVIQGRLQKYSNLIEEYNTKLCKPQNIYVAKMIGLEPEQGFDTLLGEPF